MKKINNLVRFLTFDERFYKMQDKNLWIRFVNKFLYEKLSFLIKIKEVP